MKYLLLIIGLFFGESKLAAQNDMPRLEALKIAYMTKELNLTSEEAQKFWPVYNTYFDDLKKTRLAYKNGDVITQEEKMIEVKRKYFVEFKKVLASDERANKVFLSEKNFLNLVKKEIQQRAMKRFNNRQLAPTESTP